MRGRKRRTKYSWFPILGAESAIVPEGDDISLIGGGLDITPGDPLPLDVIELTWDYPTEVEIANNTVPSLADFQGSEYQLERIVGKCFCEQFEATQAGETFTGGTSLVCAGFMVLRVDEATGAPLRAADIGEYNPLIAHNAQDPWIWRRTWMLRNDKQWITSAIPWVENPRYPGSNAGYGDIESGPHIDSRSVRRVKREERLFFLITACKIVAGAPQAPLEGEPTISVYWTLDYRILGRLLKASARGNTSR